ncbi:hypothetical protein ACCO45_009075 [Purpureocillium lilacinum]|uniref:Uncharacterized protein n=1 Tax=Purpureocillium lilacinum TaxID=33203 RepID=A0ACC4DK38_PURLI
MLSSTPGEKHSEPAEASPRSKHLSQLLHIRSQRNNLLKRISRAPRVAPWWEIRSSTWMGLLQARAPLSGSQPLTERPDAARTWRRDGSHTLWPGVWGILRNSSKFQRAIVLQASGRTEPNNHAERSGFCGTATGCFGTTYNGPMFFPIRTGDRVLGNGKGFIQDPKRGPLPPSLGRIRAFAISSSKLRAVLRLTVERPGWIHLDWDDQNLLLER